MSDFKKWISLFESKEEEKSPSDNKCSCNKWNCKACFPEDKEKVDEGNWFQPEMDDLAIDSEEIEVLSPEDYQQAWDMISIIKDAQLNGTGQGEKNYSESELETMSMSQLRAVYKEVTGSDLIEASTKVKDKTKVDYDPLDSIDDILNPKSLTVTDAPSKNDTGDNEPSFNRSSASDTRRKTSGINPSDTMRDYMSRINPEAGGDEPEIEPPVAGNELTVTSAQVPAAISDAMVATGFQTPEWHTINNLPGYMQRAIRGMGRQLFGMITATPLEKIMTVANVEGQGPNTDAEMRAIAGWLVKNAEDLGEVRVDHGMAIPGYEPQVREFRTNGVRFHVVKDPMGQYIYAYPEQDAKTNKTKQTTAIRGNEVPRINEIFQPTLMEQLSWDDEIDRLIAEAEELEESTLSKLIGKQKGGQRLVRWLHKMHKMSNEAELVPVPYKQELLWTQFKKHPDDFVIVSAENGVAGIKPSQAHIEQQRKRYADKGKEYNPAVDHTLRYQIIAFTDDGEQVDPATLRPDPAAIKMKKDGSNAIDAIDRDPTVTRARMGLIYDKDTQNEFNVFELLKQQIGRIRTVWISGWSGYRGSGDESMPTGPVERDKMGKRSDLRKPMPDADALDKIFLRFKPMIKATAEQTKAHMMRRITKFVQAGNFEGARELASRAEKINELIALFDTSKDVSISNAGGASASYIRGLLNNVVSQQMARTGENNRNAFLNDVANGPTPRIRPFLDAIRTVLAS